MGPYSFAMVGKTEQDFRSPISATSASLKLVEDGMSPKERAESSASTISEFLEQRDCHGKQMLGYPFAMSQDISELCRTMQPIALNNAGDPFQSVHVRVNSHNFETAVIEWFASLYGLKAEDTWGYVTSGGTESILQALYTAREIFPAGILYASVDSHHSVFKAANLLRMELKKIPTQESGEIDYEHLKRSLTRNKGNPAIINATIGTTFFGACDDVKKIVEALRASDYDERDFYIHCDAALSGMLVPFLHESEEEAALSFEQPIRSLGVCCQKFLGIPMPCAVLVMRSSLTSIHTQSISYMSDSRDATLTCSRNGHTPIYIWYTVRHRGKEGIKQDVLKCVRNARLLQEMLQEAGVSAVLHPKSITVIVPRPSEEIVNKWQLACQGSQAHVIVMPHHTPDLLSSFAADFIATGEP